MLRFSVLVFGAFALASCSRACGGAPVGDGTPPLSDLPKLARLAEQTEEPKKGTSAEMDARVQKFVQAHGKDDLWEYLRASPAVSTVDLAAQIGDVIPIRLDELALRQAQAKRQQGELVRNLVARRIQGLDDGWAKAKAFDRQMVFFEPSFRRPFSTLVKSMERILLEESPPPKDWKPTSSEDPILRGAYEKALAALPPPERDMVSRGESAPDPGDLSYALVEPALDGITWDDDTFVREFAALPTVTANLLAVYACKDEVDNGGLQQFFWNSTGVSAPEAKAGFAAIGMPRAAALLDRAMQRFGSPYPRARAARMKLAGEPFSNGKPREDPFRAMDDEFYALMKSEAGGFEVAADAYAATSGKKAAP